MQCHPPLIPNVLLSTEGIDPHPPRLFLRVLLVRPLLLRPDFTLRARRFFVLDLGFLKNARRVFRSAITVYNVPIK